MCKLLKVVRVDLLFTRLWSASERQFRAFLRLGTLQIARLGLLSSSKSPERKWGGILKEASGNWHQRLVWAWNDADSAHKWSEPFPIQKDKSLPTVRGHKTKRQQGTKLLLEKLRDGKQPPVLWTDEKLFKVQAVLNHQNDQIYAVNKRDIPLNDRLLFRRQKPASIMVWARVTS